MKRLWAAQMTLPGNVAAADSPALTEDAPLRKRLGTGSDSLPAEGSQPQQSVHP